MAEKINKEALKHAEKYASNITTVIKRAYYDEYLHGKKVDIKIDSDKVVKTLKKLPNGRQGKVLAYLKIHDNACVHDIMKVLKSNNLAQTSTILNVLVHKGLVESEKEIETCKECKKLHKRYKLI